MRWLLFLVSLASFGQGIPFNANGMIHAQGGSSFSHYRTITVDHTKVPNTDQTDFPVMFRSFTGTVNTVATAITLATGDNFPVGMDAIDIAGTTYTFTRTNGTTGTTGSSAGTQTGATYSSTPYLKTIANGGLLTDSNGYDAGLYTSSACTTKLDWERVTWSATTGAAEFHFRVGTLTTGSDYVAYLCYVNAGVTTDQSNKTAVWDTSFAGVWHWPDGSTLGLADSTSNANNGSNSGLTATTGQIDGGVADDGAHGATIATSASLNITGAITLSAWVKAINSTARVVFGGYQNSGGYPGYALRITDRAGYYNGSGWADCTSTMTDGNWHYIAISVVSTTASCYLDGVADGTPTSTVPSSYSGQRALLAASDLGDGFFDGSVDEIRVSSTNRSADWINTGYNNQAAPGTFYTVGAQN